MKDCDPSALVTLQCFPCVVTVVHVLKQEKTESTKLPVLFQPFLRFAEDIPQFFFFALLGTCFLRVTFNKSNLFWREVRCYVAHENRYNQWLMARAIFQVKSHAIYFRDTVVFVCATVQQ